MRFLLLVAFGLPLLASGRDEPRPIWQWSSEDRLAVRFDPAKAARRTVDSDVPGGERLWGRLSGATNPELFLPSELFISLLDGLASDPTYRASSRAVLRDRVIEFGFEEETFWRELEGATTRYLRLAQRRDGLLRRLSPESVAQEADILAEARGMDASLCEARAAALVSARRHFGGERFDRFLYTVVAPGLSISTTAASADTPRQLLFIEGGCQ